MRRLQDEYIQRPAEPGRAVLDAAMRTLVYRLIVVPAISCVLSQFFYLLFHKLLSHIAADVVFNHITQAIPHVG